MGSWAWTNLDLNGFLSASRTSLRLAPIENQDDRTLRLAKAATVAASGFQRSTRPRCLYCGPSRIETQRVSPSLDRLLDVRLCRWSSHASEPTRGSGTRHRLALDRSPPGNQADEARWFRGLIAEAHQRSAGAALDETQALWAPGEYWAICAG